MVARKVKRFLLNNTFQKIRRFFYYFLSEIKYKHAIAVQPLLVNGLGSVNIGNKSFIGNYYSQCYLNGYSYIEARKERASVNIGANCYFNNNVQIIANKKSITIGQHCRIGFNFFAITSDFHHIDSLKREQGDEGDDLSIVIGNHVFIGNDVKILKGVTVGNGCVIAAGSIVTSNIPDNTLAGGIPARVIKELKDS